MKEATSSTKTSKNEGTTSYISNTNNQKQFFLSDFTCSIVYE